MAIFTIAVPDWMGHFLGHFLMTHFLHFFLTLLWNDRRVGGDFDTPKIVFVLSPIIQTKGRSPVYFIIIVIWWSNLELIKSRSQQAI